EVLDASVGRLVDRARRRTPSPAGAHLAGAADQLVAAQLVECRVDARWREARGSEPLLKSLCELIPIAGTLDHEPQYRVLRRHSRPSSSTGVCADGTRIDAVLHSKHGMNHAEWNWPQPRGRGCSQRAAQRSSTDCARAD